MGQFHGFLVAIFTKLSKHISIQFFDETLPWTFVCDIFMELVKRLLHGFLLKLFRSDKVRDRKAINCNEGKFIRKNWVNRR